MRFLSIALAAIVGTLGLVSFNAGAADAAVKTVAATYKDKAALKGKQITVEGKRVYW